MPSDESVENPLDDRALAAEVDRLLGEEPAEPLPPAPLPGTESWPSLVAAYLIELYAGQRTGTLQLRGAVSLQIHFHNGLPIDVVATTDEEDIGTFLQRQGLLSEFDHQRARQVAIDRRLAIADSLGILGLYSADQWALYTRAHKREALLRAFAWSTGQAEFASGGPVRQQILRLNPVALILEGVERVFPSSTLSRELDARAEEVVRPGDRFDLYLPLFAPFLYSTGLHIWLGGEHPLSTILDGRDESAAAIRRQLKALEIIEALELSRGESTDPGSPSPLVDEPTYAAESSPSFSIDLASLAGADHYAALGVSRDADDSALREAFLARVGQISAASDPAIEAEGLLRMAAAYGALCDVELRAHYDRRLAASEGRASAPAIPRAQSQADMRFAEGKAAFERGDFSKAVSLFGEALSLNGQLPQVHLYLGLARYQGDKQDPQNIQEAMQAILRAVELDPENDVAYYELGQIYREQGIPSKARMMFTRALQVNPNNHLARRALEKLRG
jgi:tetratricopeptide (TPR) repeat protein